MGSVQGGFSTLTSSLSWRGMEAPADAFFWDWRDEKSSNGTATPTVLLNCWVFSWSPLLLPSCRVNMGFSLFHASTENVTSSCTRRSRVGHPSSLAGFPGAAQDMAEAASQDCKACKDCNFLHHWDLSVCCTHSYYQKVLKWDNAISPHLSWAAPIRLLIFSHPSRRDSVSRAAFQRLLLSLPLEIPWNSLS